MARQERVLTYKWMVEYTPQEEWIEEKGLFLMLAFFFTEIFAGVYFVSLFLDVKAGFIVGWIGSLALGGVFHLLYLGKMTRGWRIMFKVGSSELSRGMWVIGIFAGLGFLQILPMVYAGVPWAWNHLVLKVLMGIVCILVISHGFLTMSIVKALPMWNSSMMVPLSLASGIFVGAQFVSFILKSSGSDVPASELWVRYSMIAYIATLFVYLWGNLHASETAKASVRRILSGDCSFLFYLGTVFFGIAIPVLITVLAWTEFTPVNAGGAFFRGVCVVVGDCAMRYCIMKAPVYTPLI